MPGDDLVTNIARIHARLQAWTAGSRAYTAYLEGIGFRALSYQGCVDYELGAALNYHRPANIAAKFPDPPVGAQSSQMVKPHACPDSPFTTPTNDWQQA